jgi:hypothetical protein
MGRITAKQKIQINSIFTVRYTFLADNTQRVMLEMGAEAHVGLDENCQLLLSAYNQSRTVSTDYIKTS